MKLSICRYQYIIGLPIIGRSLLYVLRTNAVRSALQPRFKFEMSRNRLVFMILLRRARLDTLHFLVSQSQSISLMVGQCYRNADTWKKLMTAYFNTPSKSLTRHTPSLNACKWSNWHLSLVSSGQLPSNMTKTKSLGWIIKSDWNLLHPLRLHVIRFPLEVQQAYSFSYPHL